LFDGAFESSDNYEAAYLELATTIGNYYRHSGRSRLASRLEAEKAELYARNGDFERAAAALLPIINICSIDRWDRAHFWRLFRLASCQRRTGRVASYLNTLTQCFGPHVASVAPKKALEALQKDFEALIKLPRISSFRLGIAPFIETDLDVTPTSAGKSSMLLNFVRKKLVKNLCKVGETMQVTLTVTSYLPKPIELDELKLLVVPVLQYEASFTNKTIVTEEDAFEVLSLDTSVDVEPGRNTYEFSWTPFTTALFVLATTQLKWQSACFHYDSVMVRKPLLGVEVLPSSPTQSLEVHPLFLIPGQVQQVRVSFNPGEDVIEEATLELICSDGLEVIPPGVEPERDDWDKSCKILLPPFKSQEPFAVMTTVRSSVVSPTDASEVPNSASYRQTMHAKVTTSYRHARDKSCRKKGNDREPLCMSKVLESMVTTLDKPAFSVIACNALEYDDEHVMIDISLHCNTPVPFYIKEWDVQLPYLRVAESGDSNKDMFSHAVAEGEELSLGFDCVRSDGDYKADISPALHIVLQDEFGKTFRQVLPLDLEIFYDRKERNDEYTGMTSVVSELKCSTLEGLVGAPVTLEYCVDTSSLPQQIRNDDNTFLMYELSCEETEWIVSGKIEGFLQCSDSNKKFSLEFVGIPVQPGVIKTFPNLSFEYRSTRDDMPPISVQTHSKHPAQFKSLAFLNHMALACRAGI
jgi:hypothetical protein